MPAPAPDPVRALFEKLADEFDFSTKIVDRFMDLKLQSLSDFRLYVRDETEIEKAFIDGVPNLETPRLQLARVRHAWSSCVAESRIGRPRRCEDDEEVLLPAAR